MAFLTFVTTCRNRLAHLRQSLPLMLAQPDTACVVVDYDCSEGTADWVAKNHPQATVVRERDRPRFEMARARNCGGFAARSEWIFFVDADVLLAPDFAARVRPLLASGQFYQAWPRDAELWGSAITARADFERLGGYDEVLQGWGKDDDDYYARLVLAGVRYATFPGELLRKLPHDEQARVASFDDANRDRWLSESINHVYCRAKLDLMMLRHEPVPLEVRRRLYDQIGQAVRRSRETGQPLTINVPVMTEETRACGPIQAQLTYQLPRPRGDGQPNPRGASLVPAGLRAASGYGRNTK